MNKQHKCKAIPPQIKIMKKTRGPALPFWILHESDYEIGYSAQYTEYSTLIFFCPYCGIKLKDLDT